MKRRGHTLIDLMVAVAMLALGVQTLMYLSNVEEATRRPIALEALARVAHQEMERVRACPDLRAVERLIASKAPALGDEPVGVTRRLSEGPDGTWRVELEVRHDSSGLSRRLTALIEVAP